MSREPATSHAKLTDPGWRCPRGGVLFVVLGVVAIAAATAEYLVAGTARLWLANGAWLLSSLVAAGGVAAVRQRTAPRDRGGWTFLLWGCGAWFVGEVCWTAYGLTGPPSSPHPADVAWLAFAVLGGLSVMRLGAQARGRTVSWLELVPLTVAAWALLTALLWRDLRLSGLSSTAVMTTLAYPALYVTTALVMVQSVITGTLDLRGNAGLALVVVGLVVEAVGFVLWTPLLLSGGYVVGTNAVDALWTIGMLCIGAGAAIAAPPRSVPDVERVSERRGAVLPSVTFALIAVVQAILILADAPAGAELALCLAMALSGATLGARSLALYHGQTALYARLQEREAELREINHRLSQESRRDALTGLYNRLGLDEDLARLRERADRNDGGYCLVLCDLDRFKAYNDALGHQAGDRALRHVAAMLDAATRTGDRVYRYGGEEILLVLADQDAAGGAAVAERHRSSLERAAFPHPDNPPSGIITFSAGVAAARPGERPADVLGRADEALYRAKSSGRNQIAVAASEPQEPAGDDDAAVGGLSLR